MDEEPKTEAAPEESKTATEDTGAGDKSEGQLEIERLNTETEGLKKAIAEKANASARAQIAGVTDGKAEEEKPVEVTPQEYAQKLLKGELEVKQE